MEILSESLEYERETLKLYYELLEHVGPDVALEELVRKQIADETLHIEEVEKMIRSGGK